MSITLREVSGSDPRIQRLIEDLDPQAGGSAAAWISTTLLRPVNDLISRPSKHLRAHLVRTGYEMAAALTKRPPSSRSTWPLAAEILELLHAASLIVDDIQDQSPVRRGAPSLHQKYGTPLALNAGNWLYFWPLEKIAELDLPPRSEHAAIQRYHRTLIRAHMGQSLDLGLRIDALARGEVRQACLTAIRLKSGALTSLAFSLGALCGGCEPARSGPFERMGMSFGTALQMLDDAGNLRSPRAPQKEMEDLARAKPTWIWAVAASALDDWDYEELIELLREARKNGDALRSVRARLEELGVVEHARRDADECLREAVDVYRREIRRTFGRGADTSALEWLIGKLRSAYD